jgi:hypothetical protein
VSLINISICLSDLPKDKIKQAENQKKYINLCLSPRREKGIYGETHKLFVPTTKEEREAGMNTIYVGHGKEFIPQTVTSESINSMPAANNLDDLPF